MGVQGKYHVAGQLNDMQLVNPRKEAMNLHLKNIRKSEEERAAKIRDDRGQQTIISSLNSMQRSEVEKTMKTFEVAYYITKGELPLAEYESLAARKEIWR